MRHAAVHPSLAKRVDLRRFIAALRDPVLVLEAESRSIVYSNLPAEALFGYSAQEMVGLAFEALVPGYGQDTQWAIVPRAEEDGPTPVLLYKGLQKSGEGLALHLSVSAAPASDHNLLVAIARPALTDSRAPSADLLAGIPNRVQFQERLKQVMSLAKRHGWMVGVISMDVDQFSLINDTLGYDAGDALLAMVVERLKICLRDYDLVARFGSDEFLILLTDLKDEAGLLRAVERLRSTLVEAFPVGGQEIILSASVGISHYPLHGDDPSDLVKFACVAKRHAKDQMTTAQIYLDGMDVSAPRNLKLLNNLYRAIERNELFLHYQPQIDLHTGKIIGAEALVRWNHPELGVVPPLQFIPLAEETGFIATITEWVLKTACEQNKAWQRAGLGPIRIAVNLSAHNFRQDNLLATIEMVLAETGLDPQHLELEITENALVANVEKTNHLLKELTAAGIFISLDDFGTGYSSLSYLKRFPLTTLKIDRAFVRDIETDPNDAMIVTAIIALAHSLKLKVIAEGVENKAQLDYLATLGCDQIQGFYFSRPVSAEAFGELLRGTRLLEASV